MRLSFDTSKVGTGERAGFWREVVCSVYVPMDAEPLERRAFHGRMDARAALGRIFSDIDAGPQRVGRDARQIAASAARDIFTFVIQREGSCAVEQAGRSALLLPGDMLVFHNSRPYRLLFAHPFRQTVIQAPRDTLGRQAEAIDRTLGQRLASGSGFGRMLGGYVRSLSEALEEIEDAELAMLVDELFRLLAGHGELDQAGSGEDAERARRALVLRAQRCARERIASPELDPATIAREQRISTRTLQRAFAAQGTTVTRWMREERLELCAQALLDRAHDGRTISAIAAAHGIRDTAAFCRSFKARFGCSPGAWRRARTR
jgi:AraC-like DNA-binding protein